VSQRIFLLAVLLWVVFSPRLASAQVPGSDDATPPQPAGAPGGPLAPKAPEGPQRPAQPRHATATEPSLATRLEWRWPKFTPYEFGVALGMGGLAIGSLAIPGQSNWGAGGSTNDFDKAARDGLRLKDPEASLYARDASDVGLTLLFNQRFVDTLFVTWWYHDKGSTALQMALVDGQTIAFAAGIQSFTAAIVGRERPYASQICDESPEKESSDCAGNNRTRSFFSGHATMAFTLASLTCVHHINLPIYGGGVAEAVPCAATMVVAGGVALLRVVSDQHNITDIMTGAAFGTAIGFGVPYLFHYGWELTPDKVPALKAAGTESMSVMPNPAGFSIGGMF
jgi:membrane-associated phospholipid phosphatase